MALSLAVLIVPILVLLAGYRFVGGERATVVDPSAAYADAERAFPVARPVGLPAGWEPVSATFRDGVLRVGFRAPGGGTAQLVETNGPAEPLLGADLRDDRTESVAGREWRRYVATDGERALVLTGPGRTVIVLGRDPAELARYLG